MHRSSESIGTLAAALAKAQAELTNPEKSLIATIRSSVSRESDLTFRYASLASGLDIVRKALGQREIATVQTTAIDQQSGQIRLTTLLAHSSGEWISSNWPVCSVSETATPHRMGAALNYARRYALFALVGIAGEDDLDAPDLLTEPAAELPAPAETNRSAQTNRKPSNGSIHNPWQPKPLLASQPSASLREQLIAEIGRTKSDDELAVWARRRLPAKNSLTADDARAVETAYLVALPNPHRAADVADPLSAYPPSTTEVDGLTGAARDHQAVELVTPLHKTIRKRNKAHLRFVAAQPCLICKRTPCDAHHLKFAQPRSLGRKVSDEFTVPLCREHHQQLHRYGNEAAWWANVQIAPIEVAKDLWDATLLQVHRPTQHGQLNRPRDPEIVAAK
jgi:hypothetical protein